MSRLPKKERQSLLLEKIKEDPFLTDEILAEKIQGINPNHKAGPTGAGHT